jgi:hypothetical protein
MGMGVLKFWSLQVQCGSLISDRRQHFPTKANLKCGALRVEGETSAILIDRIQR